LEVVSGNKKKSAKGRNVAPSKDHPKGPIHKKKGNTLQKTEKGNQKKEDGARQGWGKRTKGCGTSLTDGTCTRRCYRG